MKRENYSFLKGSRRSAKKTNQKVYQLIDELDANKLYTINYKSLKQQFLGELENYKKYPQLIDIDEFSMNYVFGYHFLKGIDSFNSKQAMFIEVKNYLNDLRKCA